MILRFVATLILIIHPGTSWSDSVTEPGSLGWRTEAKPLCREANNSSYILMFMKNAPDVRMRLLQSRVLPHNVEALIAPKVHPVPKLGGNEECD
jgi:hypothetical protein